MGLSGIAVPNTSTYLAQFGREVFHANEENNMTAFRYDMSGQWYKGNTHIHSTASDGGKGFAELARLYAAEGYHFLFRADHWVASDTSQDTEAYPLLWLDGTELDGRDDSGALFHVVCLGRIKGIDREQGLVAAIRTARQQGALIVIAHPFWTGQLLRGLPAVAPRRCGGL